MNFILRNNVCEIVKYDMLFMSFDNRHSKNTFVVVLVLPKISFHFEVWKHWPSWWNLSPVLRPQRLGGECSPSALPSTSGCTSGCSSHCTLHPEDWNPGSSPRCQTVVSSLCAFAWYSSPILSLVHFYFRNHSISPHPCHSWVYMYSCYSIFHTWSCHHLRAGPKSSFPSLPPPVPSTKAGILADFKKFTACSWIPPFKVKIR